MWIARINLKHDCILGNRCEKFNVILQSVAFSTYKEKGTIISSSMHHLVGNERNIDLFVKDLKKDKKVISLERKGNMFLLLEKADKKAVSHHTPKIIFIKPTLIDIKGYEYWEIGSWEKEEVSRFIANVEKEISNFKLLKFSNVKMDDIFFPKFMPDLTAKQKQAVELAISKGYYKNPRKIDLRKLAKLMKLSLSTYQQHLRTAEEKLLPNALRYSE